MVAVTVLIDTRTQEPVKRPAPFQAGGRILAAPYEHSALADVAPAAAASSTATTTVRKTITVDDSLPSTSLQIRFADSSHVVARFNTSHTINDLRAHRHDKARRNK